MEVINGCFLLLCFYLCIIKCEESKDENMKSFKSWANGQYLEMIKDTQIFYQPNTNIPVPLISREDNTDVKTSKGVYGWLPCHCSRESCECCVDIKFKTLNVRENGCVKFFTKNNDSSNIFTKLMFNGRSMLEQRLTFENALPLCLPFPPFPAISICMRIIELAREGWNVKVCAAIELRITGTLDPLWNIHFSCIKIGLSGLSFPRPNITDNAIPSTPRPMHVLKTTPTSLESLTSSQYNEVTQPLSVFFVPTQENSIILFPNYKFPIQP